MCFASTVILLAGSCDSRYAVVKPDTPALLHMLVGPSSCRVKLEKLGARRSYPRTTMLFAIMVDTLTSLKYQVTDMRHNWHKRGCCPYMLYARSEEERGEETSYPAHLTDKGLVY